MERVDILFCKIKHHKHYNQYKLTLTSTLSSLLLSKSLFEKMTSKRAPFSSFSSPMTTVTFELPVSNSKMSIVILILLLVLLLTFDSK